MTETRPVYHADIAGLATERRRALLYAALNDAGAAEAGLLRLVAYIAAQRATFKQLTSDGLMSYLKPLNPAYPTQAIDNERIRIVGVVIEWFVGGKL